MLEPNKLISTRQNLIPLFASFQVVSPVFLFELLPCHPCLPVWSESFTMALFFGAL